jgi:hypothetical protein
MIDGPEQPQLRNMPRLAALFELSASVALVVVFKLWRCEVAGGGWRDGCGGEVRVCFGLVLGPRSAVPKSVARGCGEVATSLLWLCAQTDHQSKRLKMFRAINRPEYSNLRNNKTSSPFGIGRYKLLLAVFLYPQVARWEHHVGSRKVLGPE